VNDAYDVEDEIFNEDFVSASTIMSKRKLKLLKQRTGETSNKEALIAAVNFYLKNNSGGGK